MTNQYTTANQAHPTGGYVVRTPLTTDALGQTLRTAYGSEASMPCDIARCLKALDRIERH